MAAMAMIVAVGAGGGVLGRGGKGGSRNHNGRESEE